MIHLFESDGSKNILYLDNLWILCQNDKPGAADTIERYLVMAENLGDEPPLRREQIIPWVKDQIYVQQFLENSTIAREHLAADFWIVYAADGDGSSTAITDEDIERMGIPRESVRDLAIENLRRILPPIEMHEFYSCLLLCAGANYVPSLLLLDVVWEHMASQVKGDIVVAAPISDSVFVAGTESPEGVAHIRERALVLEAEGDHVVTSTLLRRIPGGWKAFD